MFTIDNASALKKERSQLLMQAEGVRVEKVQELLMNAEGVVWKMFDLHFSINMKDMRNFMNLRALIAFLGI